MNNRYLILFLILIVFLTTGCSSLTNLSSDNYSITKINKNDFNKLNGIYNNYQDTVFGEIIHNPGRAINESDRSLLDRLFISIPDEAYSRNTTVELKFISENVAILNAYKNDSLFLTKEIKGKFKEGYFYVRPKIFIIPFFPIFYWHNFERVRIGKSDKNLIVDHTLKSWGFALVAGGSDDGLTTSIYLNVEK